MESKILIYSSDGTLMHTIESDDIKEDLSRPKVDGVRSFKYYDKDGKEENLKIYGPAIIVFLERER